MNYFVKSDNSVVTLSAGINEMDQSGLLEKQTPIGNYTRNGLVLNPGDCLYAGKSRCHGYRFVYCHRGCNLDMARTIRLNTSTGAAAGGGAAGLNTADVERVVEDKARWILDYEKDYGATIPNGWLPLIPAIDFDNCFRTRY